MNKYITNLGASKDWGFYDVFGFEPELLMMVPRPVAAVVMLYPLTEKVTGFLSDHMHANIFLIIERSATV